MTTRPSPPPLRSTPIVGDPLSTPPAPLERPAAGPVRAAAGGGGGRRITRVSAEGRALIAFWERFSATVYRCQAGKPTIGYGHVVTAADRAALRFARPITLAEAEALLTADLASREDQVASLNLPLTQGQFDGLVSWVFNVGWLPDSGLLDLARARRWPEVADRLLDYNKVRNPKTGRLEVSRGLARRRAADRAIFLGRDWRAAL